MAAAAALQPPELCNPCNADTCRGWALDRGGLEGLTAGTPAPLLRAAPAVLEDMAVAAADAVAARYLAEAGLGLDGGPARAAGGGLAPGAWPTYLHPRLANTRALERFRNQVRQRGP